MSSTISASLRQAVAERSYHQCSYCRSQEDVVGMLFTIDHIIPQSLGGTDELSNLCLACWDCNRIKHNYITGYDPVSDQLVSLFHPNRHIWQEHFAWDEDGLYIRGVTATGRATVSRLQLNRPTSDSRPKELETSWLASTVSHKVAKRPIPKVVARFA